MCKILLSINPEYSSQILQGTKKYEFRRQIAKRQVDEIVIYSTFPEMKVVGSVKVNDVIQNTPEKLWEETKDFAGISKENFFSYFEGKNNAFAYKLGDVIEFDPPQRLVDYDVKVAPQSFIYLNC